MCRGIPQVEVRGLEDISTGPHDHHLQAHSIGGSVLEISVELRHPEHSLSEHSQEADSLNKGTEVDQEEHEDGGKDGDEHDELHIAGKVGPGPKELRIKIGENSGFSLLYSQVLLNSRCSIMDDGVCKDGKASLSLAAKRPKRPGVNGGQFWDKVNDPREKSHGQTNKIFGQIFTPV